MLVEGVAVLRRCECLRCGECLEVSTFPVSECCLLACLSSKSSCCELAPKRSELSRLFKLDCGLSGRGNSEARARQSEWKCDSALKQRHCLLRQEVRSEEWLGDRFVCDKIVHITAGLEFAAGKCEVRLRYGCATSRSARMSITRGRLS